MTIPMLKKSEEIRSLFRLQGRAACQLTPDPSSTVSPVQVDCCIY